MGAPNPGWAPSRWERENRAVPKRDEPMDAYRRVRKPVPRPGRAIPDRRRKAEEERHRREIEEERARRDEDHGR